MTDLEKWKKFLDEMGIKYNIDNYSKFFSIDVEFNGYYSNLVEFDEDEKFIGFGN